MIFTYVCMCSIYKYVWYKHTYIRRSLHQFTSPPSHPAEFYFVSFVCWQSNGNNQQQEQKLNLPPLSASTLTHTRTHSCLCVRCYPLNQLCGSSALLGSFFLSLSLSFRSVITSVAEQETVNVRCLFTFLCLFPAVAVYPWFVVLFPFADNKENSQYMCVWVCTCVRIDLIMHMTDNLFM